MSVYKEELKRLQERINENEKELAKLRSEALERVREEWAEMASKLDKELREKDKEKCVAEPLTDLTDAEWKYIRYIGAQIMARNPKPLGFEEWKNQKEET